MRDDTHDLVRLASLDFIISTLRNRSLKSVKSAMNQRFSPAIVEAVPAEVLNRIQMLQDERNALWNELQMSDAQHG